MAPSLLYLLVNQLLNREDNWLADEDPRVDGYGPFPFPEDDQRIDIQLVKDWEVQLEKTALPTLSARVDAPTTAIDRGLKRA